MSGAAVFGDAVFRSAFPVKEGFVAKVATPIRQAESERLAFLVEPDLLYTANRQNAGCLGEFLAKDRKFDIRTQQGEIGAAAPVGGHAISRLHIESEAPYAEQNYRDECGKIHGKSESNTIPLNSKAQSQELIWS